MILLGLTLLACRGGLNPVDEVYSLNERFDEKWSAERKAAGERGRPPSLFKAAFRTAGPGRILFSFAVVALLGTLQVRWPPTSPRGRWWTRRPTPAALQFVPSQLSRVLLRHIQGDETVSESTQWLIVVGLFLAPVVGSLLRGACPLALAPSAPPH